MSDRVRVLTVVLDQDYRSEDDVRPIIELISMVRGVEAVEGVITQPADYLARAVARTELRAKLLAVLSPKECL